MRVGQVDSRTLGLGPHSFYQSSLNLFSPPLHPTASGAEQEQHLLSMVTELERELGHLKSELSAWQPLKNGCEKVHTIHEKVSFLRFYMLCDHKK